MNRKNFLTLAAMIGGTVGLLALAMPEWVLQAKGITSEPAAVWVRQVGVLLMATAGAAAAVRAHAGSPTLAVLLWANAFIQLGLLAVEAVAWAAGTLPALSGVLPNGIVHLLLAAGFAWHGQGVKSEMTQSDCGVTRPGTPRPPPIQRR